MRFAMKPSLLIVLMITLVVAARAQQTEPAQTPGEQPESAPATLAGQKAQHEPLTEASAPNYMTTGIAITQVFTDNAELASSGRISDLSYDIEPHLAFNHSAPRLSYSLGIFAGFIVNRTLEERNQATQTASLDLSYGLTRFTTLRLSDGFRNSTGLWSGSGDEASPGSSGGVGVVEEPNSALFTYGEFRANIALAELSRQFSANGIGGLRATQSYLWYPNAATSTISGTLYGGETYSAEAFYNHRFSSRQWVGVTLRGQRFDTDHSEGRTDAASALFLYGINIKPKMSLSLFGGPELSVISIQGIPASDLPFPQRTWSPAAGAVFSWQGQRTGATASFVHQISNGEGLSSAVTVNGANAALTRQLSPRWGAELGFTYAQNEPIVTSPTIRFYSGRLQFTSYITNNITVSGGYARDDDTSSDSRARASADRVWISFSYSFSRPLGR